MRKEDRNDGKRNYVSVITIDEYEGNLSEINAILYVCKIYNEESFDKSS